MGFEVAGPPNGLIDFTWKGQSVGYRLVAAFVVRAWISGVVECVQLVQGFQYVVGPPLTMAGSPPDPVPQQPTQQQASPGDQTSIASHLARVSRHVASPASSHASLLAGGVPTQTPSSPRAGLSASGVQTQHLDYPIEYGTPHSMQIVKIGSTSYLVRFA